MRNSQSKQTPSKSRLTSAAPIADRCSAPIVTLETYHPPETQPEWMPSSDMRPAFGWHRHSLARADLIIAMILFGAAMLARWPFITVGQTLLNPDEAIVGLMAQDIVAGERFPIYFYGQRYMGSLEALVIAAVSPLFAEHVQALRFGPAMVFAAFVALQSLMITRWFSRRAGIAAALLAIAGSPMFMHWSISARGGYIEILLWGTALIWAYSEWFVPPAPQLTRGRQLTFGFLIGSGMWINPSIALFIAPIVVHALLFRPLAALDRLPVAGNVLSILRAKLGRATLPVCALGAILALNVTWSVWVDQPHVRSVLLMGILPAPAAGAFLGLIAVAAAGYAIRKTPLLQSARAWASRHPALVAGMVIGASPAILYTARAALRLAPMEPSLPLGIRPLWLTGETMVYLLHGLPLLFGADPRPFVSLMSVGHSDVSHPLSIEFNGLLAAANWLVIGALLSAAMTFVWINRASLRQLFRLEPTLHSPQVFLAGAAAITIILYVLGGCTMNFSTIRYLIPLWAFLPGLLVSIWCHRRMPWVGPVTALCLILAWGAGQVAMLRQLGNPHPLDALAKAITAKGITTAVAEPLDAHLLSYLTNRKTHVAEFESFWMRLPHYQTEIHANRPVDYIAETRYIDWTASWTAAGWPGATPPETTRFLWPRLRSEIDRHPERVLAREPLPGGFELIRLDRPLGRPGKTNPTASRDPAA